MRQEKRTFPIRILVGGLLGAVLAPLVVCFGWGSWIGIGEGRPVGAFSISFLMAGFSVIAGSVCQAIGNPFYSMIVSVCRQLMVLLPTAWLLSQLGRLELVWWAFPIAEVVALGLSIVFLRRTIRSAGARMAQIMDN